MNDPVPEMIDIVSPTGAYEDTASREQVHADGQWHQVFHCLIIRPEAPARVVLQLRHQQARAFPGLLDLSAAGHLLAGESPLDGIRELEEEVGIQVDQDLLVPLGVRLLADDAGEGTNRELAHVFFLSDDRPLDQFNPDPDEVMGLAETSASGLLALLADDVEHLDAHQYVPGGEIEPITIVKSDLVKPIGGYWTVLLVMAERFANGQRPVAI